MPRAGQGGLATGGAVPPPEGAVVSFRGQVVFVGIRRLSPAGGATRIPADG